MNLCIPGYHKYSYFFDMPVYLKNQVAYFRLQLIQSVCLALYTYQFYRYFGSSLGEQPFYWRPLFIVYRFSQESAYFTIIMGIIVHFYSLLSMYRSCIWIYCVLSRLTLDELYNPHYYPYLFICTDQIKGTFEYRNEQSVSFIRNIILFFSNKLIM